MEFFMLFILPSLWALSMTELSDKETERFSNGIIEISESFVFVLKPIIYLALIALPFWGTWVFIHGFMGIQFEGGYKTMFGFVVFPMYPLSFFLILRVINCAIGNIKTTKKFMNKRHGNSE